MLLNNIKNIKFKSLSVPILVLIILLGLLFFINKSASATSKENQEIFAYTVKVRDAVEELDKVFERAEVNVSVMVDSISSSYNINKRLDQTYNLQFVDNIEGLVKSVLSNSPSVDGSWFQINADLPFSSRAYNWYEFKDNQFVNIKDQFSGTSSIDRKITPEDDPYYFDAIMNQRPTWSDIYTDADTKDSMMTISAPIYKEATLVGVVGIDISTSNLQQVLKYMQSILGKSDLYLLDKKGYIILSQLSHPDNLSKDKTQFLKLFQDKEQGPIEYFDGVTKKTAIMMTLSNDYKIAISIENKTLFSGTSGIVNLCYLLFVLLVILTVFIGLSQFNLIKINKQTTTDKIIDVETQDENNIDSNDDNDDYLA